MQLAQGGPAGRIVPNNIHGARLDGEKRSLEENEKKRREQPRKYYLRNYSQLGGEARDPLDASVGDRTSHETHKFLEGKDAVRCDKARKNKPHQYI